MALPNSTGKNTEVSVGGQTIAYTNATFDLTFDTASSDMNDSPTPYTSVVSRYAEGTLEWDGSQVEAHEVFLNPDGSQIEGVTIRVVGEEYTYNFTEITMTNLNREQPADGKVAGTIDWRSDSFRRE